MARLIITTEGRQAEIELPELTVIGRFEQCTVPILADGLMSKQHAQIFKTGDQWMLRDLGSTNGTYLNTVRVEHARLKDGDQIYAGSTTMTFREGRAHTESLAVMGEMAAHVHAKLEGAREGRFLPVEQIRDPEQLKRDYEKLRVANELNQAIGLETDLDKLLERLLEEILPLFRADRGVILLMDRDTHQLTPRASKSMHDDGEQIVLSNTIIGEVFQNGAAVLTSNAQADSRFARAQSVIAAGLRSTMCVPMIHRSQLLGIMHVDSLMATNMFSEKDLQILTGVAAQAAQAVHNAYQAHELEKNAVARREFERLLPPEVVEQVVAGQVRLERGGQLRETTVIFTDVRGFTAWAEQHEPSYIVTILNEYFELMVDVIHKYRGTLDKFMGDGIMAMFGAPISHGRDADNAVSCALEMMDLVRQFNAGRSTVPHENIAIGIGINTGPVIAGYMGSSKRMEYTAIGDHVNLASRLCGIAEPGQILISAETARAVEGRFHLRPMEPVKVKGKRHPIMVHEVLSAAPHEATEAGQRRRRSTDVSGIHSAAEE